MKRLEAQPHSEHATVRPITELDLFPKRPPQREAFHRYVDDHFNPFSAKYMTANDSARSTQDKINGMIDKNLDLKEEAEGRYAVAHSGIAAGSVYLKMHEELSDRGVGKEDIDRLFLLCLDINTEESEEKRLGTNEQMRANELIWVKSTRVQSPRVKRVRELMTDAPAWFPKSEDWGTFLYEHSFFSYYLHPDGYKIRNGPNGKSYIKRTDKDFEGEHTFRDSMPDWLTNRSGEIDISEVAAELGADVAEKEQADQETVRLHEQRKRLRFYGDQKVMQTAHFLQLEKEKLFQQTNTFTKLMVYLYGTDTVRDDPEALLFSADMDSAAIQRLVGRKIIDTEQSVANAVDSYLSNNPYSSELLALWLERKAVDGKITDSMHNPVNQKMVDVLVEDPRTRPTTLSTLKDEDKRVHDAIKFDILPFIDLLGLDEKEYLSDFSAENPGFTVGDFIMEAASVISQKMNRDKGTQNFTPDFQRKLDEFMRFSKNTIIHNYNFFANQVFTAYEGEEQVPEPQEEQADTPILQEDEIDDRLDEIIRSEEVGNLEGWSLGYTQKRVVREGSVDLLQGATLDERRDALDKYMVRHDITLSIPLSSVMRALNEFVVKDDETLRKWDKKPINGQSFYKIKRGAGRIFCQLDRQEKKLVFFVHQKDDYYYHF